ncbi:expressed unknown protein [Seminavis robusta]|uniref:Uncharacterized protein n=1 Tax=Seminavis robusta TaxID=568900 RepID=A0A9N8D7R2_9STRA|nr:expressed unknown protein [Seminavis robusta]|eukprot:Sro29_g019010.1 n/a (258) ;mRNA; r:36579-37475
MSESLRRSSRRTIKKTTFKVGDIVEVAKVGIILRGRLVAQADSTQSNQPRWRVAFDDDNFPEEELFESSIGQVVPSDTESSPSQPPPPVAATAPAAAPPPSPSPASVAAAATARKKNRKNGRFVKSSDNATVDLNGKKSVSFIATQSEPEVAPPVSYSSNSKRTSAREQRTARRNRSHPISDTPLAPTPSLNTHPAPSHTSKKRPPSGSGSGGGKSSKKHKGGSSNTDEEVVKVPMLTGTLYLFKGLHRRAEFHRRV